MFNLELARQTSKEVEAQIQKSNKKLRITIENAKAITKNLDEVNVKLKIISDILKEIKGG